MIIRRKSPEYVRLYNKMISKKYGILNSTFYTMNFGSFKVIGKEKRKNNHTRYRIKFIDTGFITDVRSDELITGTVKDYRFPSIRGIASLGDDYKNIYEKDPELCKALLKRYTGMIERCYCEHNHNYRFYGKCGVTVSNEWLIFCNYYNDIVSLDNFGRDKILSRDFVIDKDIKQKELNEKIYSKDTVMLISEKENLENRNYFNTGNATRDKFSKYFISISPDGTETLHRNICKFARDTGISESSIRDVLKGRTKTLRNGYSFRFPTNNDYKLQCINSSTTIPKGSTAQASGK